MRAGRKKAAPEGAAGGSLREKNGKRSKQHNDKANEHTDYSSHAFRRAKQGFALFESTQKRKMVEE